MFVVCCSFVTANREDALRVRELRVRNEFAGAVHVARLDLGPDVDKYFEVSLTLSLACSSKLRKTLN